MYILSIGKGGGNLHVHEMMMVQSLGDNGVDYTSSSMWKQDLITREDLHREKPCLVLHLSLVSVLTTQCNIQGWSHKYSLMMHNYLHQLALHC